MPKYEYACRSCGERLEVVQRFTDDPLTECPACGGVLRKVFSAPAITFKGSGFYKTDNRTGRPKSETKSDGKDGKQETTDASEPAKTGPAPPPPADSKPAPKAAEAKTA
ncbi:MAG TPA: FmdB family zinc ribbon protein [Acidimicrobiales bacterium]|nr:FmdB family zinc ribbon protein [Acidimicrobiales bacterium]